MHARNMCVREEQRDRVRELRVGYSNVRTLKRNVFSFKNVCVVIPVETYKRERM